MTDAQNLLLHVSAFHGFDHQGVFTAVKVVLLKWSNMCSSHTPAHVSEFLWVVLPLF